MIKDNTAINEETIAALVQEHLNEGLFVKKALALQKTTNQNFSYTGMSKRKFVIEESNWGASLEERKKPGFVLSDVRGPRRDDFRHTAGKYWGYDMDNKISDDDSPSVVFISRGPESNMTNAGVPFSTRVVIEPLYYPSQHSFAGDRNPFFEVKQVVRLEAHVRAFTDAKGVYRSDNWMSLLAGSLPSSDSDTVDATRRQGGVHNPSRPSGIISEFIDYDYMAYDTALPFNYKQMSDIGITGQQYAKFVPEYNFYIKEYEEMLRFGTGRQIPEPLFPNLYALMLERTNEISNPTLDNHITLGGALTPTEAHIGASNKDKFNIKKHAGQYFDLYGKLINDPREIRDRAPNPPLQKIAKKFNNLIVPYDNVDLFKELTEKKELFPMYVDMEFSTDKMTEFAQILHDTNMYEDFIWYIVRGVTLANAGFASADTRVRNFVEAQETSKVQVNEDGVKTISKGVITSKARRRVWDILTWLKNNSLIDFDSGEVKQPDFSSFLATGALNNVTFLDDGSLEQELSTDPKNKFFKSIMGIVFLSKLKTFIKNRFRTYDQIIEGMPVHSETVAYRVAKFRGDETGNPVGKAIQNFWLPNSNKVDVINFADTQVKYGKRYVYKIYAYQVVINTKYNYHNLNVWSKGAAFVVSQQPELLLIEQDIFIDNHLIIDDPPVVPEVEIVPYFANGSEILFNLKSAVGEYSIPPIVLTEEDATAHAEIKRSQKLLDSENIRFKSDDPVGHDGFFEIYRIDHHPKSWSDFDGKLLTTVANNPTIGTTGFLAASSASHIDSIGSNKKYYYTFRMVDVHGHVSNPTEIYELELVNNEGSIHMNKRIVDFAPPEPKLPSKPMRRLVMIKPAFEQTTVDTFKYVNGETAGDIKSVKLGERSQAPWGRKFKFRLCSKKTGKKIDLNVDFNAAMGTESGYE